MLQNSRGNSFGGKISDEDVIMLALNPFPAKRMGDVFPHLVHQDGFENMQEYDEVRLKEIHENFQKKLNNEVGILSLTRDNKNPVMWSSYANDYNGIVLEFDERIASMPGCNCKEVIYDPEEIDCEVSLNQGIVRFNGLKVDGTSPDNVHITDELIESFLFHKEKLWIYEDEFRLITRLVYTDKTIKNTYLKRIPFSLFRAVYVGNNMPGENIEAMKTLIRSNPELSHINVYRQTFNNLSGDIEFSSVGL